MTLIGFEVLQRGSKIKIFAFKIDNSGFGKMQVCLTRIMSGKESLGFSLPFVYPVMWVSKFFI